MGSYGNLNYKEFNELKKQIEQLDNKKTEFIEACAKELAARLLRAASNKTPVGVYPSGSGKVGGTLRRGWTVGNIQHVGDMYKIEIVNPVEYASYVEYGHRQEPGRFVPAIGKRLKESWVEGKFMMTIAEQEIDSIAPRILEKKLKKMLGEVIG